VFRTYKIEKSAIKSNFTTTTTTRR